MIAEEDEPDRRVHDDEHDRLHPLSARASDQVSMWSTFECDGRTFEYAAFPAKQQAGTGGPSVPIVMVVVRHLSHETGPATLYPDGTTITVEHAIETARRFWDVLTADLDPDRTR